MQCHSVRQNIGGNVVSLSEVGQGEMVCHSIMENIGENVVSLSEEEHRGNVVSLSEGEHSRKSSVNQ